MARREFAIPRSDGFPAGFVPWAIAEQAYDTYKIKNDSLSLELLASRGGFTWLELAILLKGINPYELEPAEREAAFKELG